MKIEKQVLTIEQMQHLKDLGVEVEDTALCWTKYPVYELDGKLGWRWRVVISEDGTMCKDGLIPTLTLQEILEMLPEEIRFEEQRAFLIIDKSDRQISYTAEDYDGNLNIDCIFFENESLLQAAYNMLCWVAENGYLNKE